MKAICIERIFACIGDSFLTIEKGEIVEYTVNEKCFIVKDAAISPTTFFAHFKVVEGKEKCVIQTLNISYVITYSQMQSYFQKNIVAFII